MRKRRLLSWLILIAVASIPALYNLAFSSENEYRKITTPLPENTVADLCSKFELSREDKRCQSEVVVYEPDFFKDILRYFDNVPQNEATFELVESKLGSYRVDCEQPDIEGNYACRYDIHGDGIYPILILFSSEDLYYRVIANTSGS